MAAVCASCEGKAALKRPKTVSLFLSDYTEFMWLPWLNHFSVFGVLHKHADLRFESDSAEATVFSITLIEQNCDDSDGNSSSTKLFWVFVLQYLRENIIGK